MKKVCNPYYDETYYTETLVNGLRVIIFHKPEYVSTMAAFGTSYGALDIAEEFKGKTTFSIRALPTSWNTSSSRPKTRTSFPAFRP